MEQRMADAEKHLQTHSSSLSAFAASIGAQDKLLLDHGQRLTIHGEALVNTAARITAIEAARQARKEEEIRREEREDARTDAMNGRMDRLENSVGSVYSLGKWLLATAGAGLILTVVNFLSKGGFTIVP